MSMFTKIYTGVSKEIEHDMLPGYQTVVQNM